MQERRSYGLNKRKRGENSTSARSGQELLDSLKDDREIWYAGERIRDVTSHPAFKGCASTLARLYDLQNDPDYIDKLTYPSPSTGKRVSTAYLIPRSGEDIVQRRICHETLAREVGGVMGRPPDFCASITVGWATLKDELSKIEPRFGENAVKYYEHCRENNICLTHALAPPQVDRSKGRDSQHDVKMVEKRSDGIVVKGARTLATLGPFADEIMLYPDARLDEKEKDLAIWFAIPLASKGLKLVCREGFAATRSEFDHPLATRFDEMDAFVIFDDVFVPWDRVFLLGDTERALRLMPPAMSWAGFSTNVREMVKAELLVGLGCLIAETIGVGVFPNVQEKLGEMIGFYELLRCSVLACEKEFKMTREGYAVPGANHGTRLMMPEIYPRFTEILELIAGAGLIATPHLEDLRNGDIGPYLAKYLRGRDTETSDRVRLFKFAYDMLLDGFGSRQRLYERFHTGDPFRNRAAIYQYYDRKGQCIDTVRKLMKYND